LFGIDGQPDTEEGAIWLGKSAEQGNTEARQLLSIVQEYEKATSAHIAEFFV
jgi:hypothetical protein